MWFPIIQPFVFMGNGMTSIFLLMLSFATGLLSDASNASEADVITYFGSGIGVLVVSWIMFIILIFSRSFVVCTNKIEMKGKE